METKPNLRSICFTDDFRRKLEIGIQCIRKLRAAGVVILRTDYDGKLPVLEIAPATVPALQGIWYNTKEQYPQKNGSIAYRLRIDGCHVVWSAAA